MAIQPIDLQALFTQLATVGKNQAAIKEAAQLEAARSGEQALRKLEDNLRSINEPGEAGKELGIIKDQKGDGARKGNSGGGREEAEKDEAVLEDEARLIRDPARGRNLDISG
jgi:hypothetical protein